MNNLINVSQISIVLDILDQRANMYHDKLTNARRMYEITNTGDWLANAQELQGLIDELEKVSSLLIAKCKLA